MKSWREAELTVLDFEGCLRSGVVELGLVRLHGGQVAETFTRLCAPVAALRPEEVRLHGISEGEASRFPPFSEEWERLVAARRCGLLVAHHAPVELGLLRATWPYPPVVPCFVEAGSIADWGPFLDTRRLAKVAFPEQPDFRLSGLIERLGLGEVVAELAARHCPADRSRPHCALYDALASAVLLFVIAETLPDPPASLAELVRLSQRQDDRGDRQSELDFSVD